MSVLSAAFFIAAITPAAVPLATAQQTSNGVQIVPDGEAASVLDVQVQNAQPDIGGGQRIRLVFTNKKAVVYNITLRPGGLAGIPDNTPLMPVMAKRDLPFDTVIVPIGTQQTIQASKVGLDDRTTERLLLLDLLTVAEVAISGSYPPTPDSINDFLASGVGGAVMDHAVDNLHSSGIDLSDAVAKLSAVPPDWTGATQDVLSAMQNAPDAFAQFATDIGWKGVLTDAGKVSDAMDAVGIAQFVNSLSFFQDVLFAPDIVTFTLHFQGGSPSPTPVPNPTPAQPSAGPLPQPTAACAITGHDIFSGILYGRPTSPRSMRW